MTAISKKDAEEDIVPNNRRPVTFRAIVLSPGDAPRRIGTIETTEDMTPEIAMTVIGDYIKLMGNNSNNSFIVIYNVEDEGIAYSQVRGIAASVTFDGGEVEIKFFDLPAPHGRARYDA